MDVLLLDMKWVDLKNEIWQIPGLDFSCNKSIEEEKIVVGFNSLHIKTLTA